MKTKKTNKKANERMKFLSGNVTSSDPLVSFLYELMRDKLTPGEVERLLRNSKTTPVIFCNGWLAQYAIDISNQLKNNS